MTTFLFGIIYLSMKNYVWSSHIWNLKFSKNLGWRNDKGIDLEQLYNFVVENFFIWNHLSKKNYIWISYIWNLNFSNDLKWKNYTNIKVVELKKSYKFVVDNFFIWIWLGVQTLISKSD
jgi:hypothetical protein